MNPIKITISNQLEEQLSPLSPEEFSNLEKSILEEGCRDSLIVWDNGFCNYLVDGHNRYKICRKHNIHYNVHFMEFENFQEVQLWITKNQLSRRNLTDKQREYLLGVLYHQEKAQGKRKDLTSIQSGEKLTTAEKLGQDYNVSKNTVTRAGNFSQAIDEIKIEIKEFTEKVLKEEVPVSRKDIIKISKMNLEERKPVIDLISKGEAKKVEEAKKILSPEEKWLKEEYKKIDKEHDNHKLVASLINEVKFRKIDQEAVEDYMKLAIDVFQEEFVKNCDKLIDKLNKMKIYHANITKIRRGK